MQFDLRPSTDAAMLAVFDPESLGDWLDVSWDDLQDSVGLDDGLIGVAEGQGKLLTISTACDGTFVVRFYLDEGPPPGTTDQARNSIHQTLLRVPSGRLWAAGYEYLPQKEMELKSVAEYHEDQCGESQQIPSGNYLVDAYAFFSPKDPTRRADAGVPASPRAALGCLSILSLPVVVILGWLTGVWYGLALPVVLACLAAPNRPDKKSLEKPVQPDVLVVLKRLDPDTDLSGLRGSGLQCL